MDNVSKTSLLKQIDSPADLRKLDTALLPQVCDELRQMIIDELSRNPGHFGSSLVRRNARARSFRSTNILLHFCIK